MSENHTDTTNPSVNHDSQPGAKPDKSRHKPHKGPSSDPENLSEQLVAETLQGRRSKCSHGCGSDGNGCSTGGCGVGSLVEMIANNFDYKDERQIVEVVYAGYRRGFASIDKSDVHLHVRDGVIVRGQNGLDWATVSMTGSLVHAKRKAKRLSNEELPRLLRKADDNDLKRIEQCKVSEQQAYSVCKTRIEAFELPMELVGTEWQFDHKKLTFYFTADGRVDFRELVRDLAAIFNTRIELRQIPVRDAAKRLGGMGVCGLELCCTTHLGRYEHVTLDHAKIQQIPANPSKLSGQCGRLKCCLLYEVDTYVEGLKRFPPLEGTIKTEQGSGVVHKIDLFKDLIFVYHPESSAWETLTLEDYRDIAAGRKTKKQREAEEERKRVEAELASMQNKSAVVPASSEKQEKQRSGQARAKGGTNRGKRQRPSKKQGASEQTQGSSKSGARPKGKVSGDGGRKSRDGSAKAETKDGGRTSEQQQRSGSKRRNRPGGSRGNRPNGQNKQGQNDG